MSDENSNLHEQTGQPVEAASSRELCSICCGSIDVVAVGACQHALTCAICTLRLRLCYRDNSCPFCKRQLKRVYVTEKPLGNAPSLNYGQLVAEKGRFETEKKWSSGIWVDKTCQCEGQRLMQYLKSKMKRTCRLCDPSGNCSEEFLSFKEMRDHFRRRHRGSTICNVCYQANRYFPRELEIFEDERSFEAHVETHPRCEYCGHHYFGKDELFSHMRKKHCLCHLCHAQGQRHVYFENTQHYSQHLRDVHYACTEPDCRDSLIAFNTAEELNNHLIEQHGMQPTGRRGTRTLHPQLLGRRLRVQGIPPQPHPRRMGFAGNELQQRGENGFRMIDDDLPPVYGAIQPVRQAPPQTLPLVRPRPLQEEYPALPVAAAAPPARPLLNIPKKVSIKRACPCGRISKTFLLPEGTQPEELKCDAECEKAQHRARLAEAFNIDTATYAGAFDVQFSADLITWARNHPQRVKQLEDQLQHHVRLRDVQRFTLDGVPRDTKKLVVSLAECYGAVGRMVHTSNAVEVVLTSRSCLPAKRLTHVASAMSEDDYNELLREFLKHTLYLEDIQKSVNVRRYLVSWDGDYEMEFLSKTVARLRFRTPQAFKSACDGLGGGIRNAFRVRQPFKEASSQAENPSIQNDEHNTGKGRPTSNRAADSIVNKEAAEQLCLRNHFEVLSRL